MTYLWHQAQGFEQGTISRAYNVEENKYIETVKSVQRRTVPADASIVLSHVVFKIRLEDDKSLCR